MATPTLQEQLDRIGEETRKLVQPERLEPLERAVGELVASGIDRQALAARANAPEFTLKDNDGRKVRSVDLLAAGPLIIKFFRGRWCPYCMMELLAWKDLYPEVRARGASLAAISPETVHQNDLLQQEHHFPFPVLSDAGCAVAESFGLAYQVPEYLQRQYRSILVNLPFINGDRSWRLPLPATYILRPNGEISFARADADFRRRPEPKDVLAALNEYV
jgi:peroxiredoxin